LALETNTTTGDTQADSDTNLRAQRASEMFKRLLSGPTVAGPSYPALPDNASDTDRLVGQVLYRVEMLEKQQALMLKVVWRSSAALIGLLASGPLKDWAISIVALMSGGV
jgi:hypothetical protein